MVSEARNAARRYLTIVQYVFVAVAAVAKYHFPTVNESVRDLVPSADPLLIVNGGLPTAPTTRPRVRDRSVTVIV